MAETFSVKTARIPFDDISKSADIQSWQLVATDVQSLSASREKSCRPQMMIVVNLSFRLGFSTEGWSWMKPARHLLMQDVIKIDVKSLPRDSSLCTLLYPGSHPYLGKPEGPFRVPCSPPGVSNSTCAAKSMLYTEQ